MDMRIKLDVNPMFREFTGEHAIPRAELDSMLPELKKAHAAVEAGRGKGMQGWICLLYTSERCAPPNPSLTNSQGPVCPAARALVQKAY